ncbi:MAG: nucleotidyltransferase domain-containing protein [Oscillospiraceae bacterium]|nr:nucleotidyltransferase domain-containing protein [Oscillospiraceae bacterium]
MMKHHEDSVKNMVLHFREDPEVSALFLIGSLATGTERPDSDIDGVAIVPQEYCDRLKAAGGATVSIWGKCTYEGGYFDVHFKTRDEIKEILSRGIEPIRNMFSYARPLFCDDPELVRMVADIPKLPEAEIAQKKLRYYCTLKQYYTYYWAICKPQGFHRNHVANGMVFCLYRLILLENKILFPSTRKMEAAVISASDKPDRIIEKCRSFMNNLSDGEAAALVREYEDWTSYNYPDPKEFQFIANNFADPYEL